VLTYVDPIHIMLHRAIVKHDSMILLFVSYSAVLTRWMDKHWAPIVTMKVPDIAGISIVNRFLLLNMNNAR